MTFLQKTKHRLGLIFKYSFIQEMRRLRFRWWYWSNIDTGSSFICWAGRPAGLLARRSFFWRRESLQMNRRPDQSTHRRVISTYCMHTMYYMGKFLWLQFSKWRIFIRVELSLQMKHKNTAIVWNFKKNLQGDMQLQFIRRDFQIVPPKYSETDRVCGSNFFFRTDFVKISYIFLQTRCFMKRRKTESRNPSVQ